MATCEVIDWDEGPHAGCAEWVAPVEVPCKSPATRSVTYLDPTWNPDSTETTEIVCGHHFEGLNAWLTKEDVIRSVVMLRQS